MIQDLVGRREQDKGYIPNKSTLIRWAKDELIFADVIQIKE